MPNEDGLRVTQARQRQLTRRSAAACRAKDQPARGWTHLHRWQEGEQYRGLTGELFPRGGPAPTRDHRRPGVGPRVRGAQ